MQKDGASLWGNKNVLKLDFSEHTKNHLKGMVYDLYLNNTLKKKQA
jgi:hypothetical protein